MPHTRPTARYRHTVSMGKADSRRRARARTAEEIERTRKAVAVRVAEIHLADAGRYYAAGRFNEGAMCLQMWARVVERMEVKR